MKIDTTMPKLAGNSRTASTITALPPSQRMALLSICHLNVVKDSSPHHASAIRPICRTSDSSSDCHSTPRSFGSVVSWVKASSKARTIYCAPTMPAAFSAPISLAEKPLCSSTSSVCWPRLAAGPLTLSLVREKRGAAAGCGKPCTST